MCFARRRQFLVMSAVYPDAEQDLGPALHRPDSAVIGIRYTRLCRQGSGHRLSWGVGILLHRRNGLGTVGRIITLGIIDLPPSGVSALFVSKTEDSMTSSYV